MSKSNPYHALQNVRACLKRLREQLLSVAEKVGRNVTAIDPVSDEVGKGGAL